MKKAYLGIKYYADHRNRDRISGITQALNRCGYKTICITRDVERWGEVSFSPQELMRRTFAIIESSDLAIIDLTVKGVGLGIEAGYAFAKNVPLLTIAQQGSDISTTLSGISRRIILYTSFEELADKLVWNIEERSVL